MQDVATPLPAPTSQSSSSLGRGVINRLVLPIIAIILVWWNVLFLLSSTILMPANDFGRILYATKEYTSGRDMYGWTRATPVFLEKNYSLNLYDMNPPHVHALFLPFTLLEDDVALMIWWVLSGLCLFHATRWTLRELGIDPTPDQRRLAMMLLLMFSATSAMIATAQLSFVLLIPITLCWLAARRGLWGWSGLFLGVALSVKPFLGVFLPYFLWRGRYRAFAGCLLSTLLSFGLGVAVFGWNCHLSWMQRLAESEGWAWLPMNASLTGFVTRTFTYSVWYVPLAEMSPKFVSMIWLTVGGAAGLLVIALTRGGRSREEVDRDFTLLLTTSILLCPLGWIYYLWLVLPPLAGLWQSGWLTKAPQQRRRAMRGLLSVAAVAFAWPIVFTRIFQPDTDLIRAHAIEGFHFATLSTLTLGNIYFWGLLAFWSCLVWDALARRKEPAPVSAAALAPLAPEDYRLSIVMPVYSETDSVRQVATWLLDHLDDQLHEIIIVQSPRSSAESQAVCGGLQDNFAQVRVLVQEQNPGLGNAVRQGFAAAQGNLVLCMDSDGEMENDTVPRMLEEMARGNHGLVTGSRWLPGGGFSGYNNAKYYLNWCFQQLFRWLFWTRLTDLTYGFKLMRAELARGIDWQGTLHEIACETTLKPVRLGVSTAEVPTRWTARTQGASKNTFWRNFRYVRMGLDILIRGVPFPARSAAQTDTLPELGPAMPSRQAAADKAPFENSAIDGRPQPEANKTLSTAGTHTR